MLKPGQTVAARYTVVDIIGRGGMGSIYRVRDNTLGEEVALKTLLPQFLQNKLVIERFFNEARIARHLSHPNIIRIHDIGQAGNLVYISMELLKGRSLRAMIDELPPGRRLPVETVLHIVDELCAALEYAHQFTIHRDIKPENVMIMPDGSVKLMDFGISKLMANEQLTSASVVMGTPMYMSPEQLRNSRDVDARADVFSVGVVLYETLTGNVPTGVPKPASQIRKEVSPDLDAIINKCVEPNRENRYRNITELRDALLGVRVSLEPHSQTLASVKHSASLPRGPILRRLAGVGLIAAILAVAGFGIWKVEQKQAEAQVRRVEQSPIEVAADPAGDAFDAQFQRIAKLVQRVRPQADLAARTDAGKQRAVDVADVYWQHAKQDAAGKSPAALAAGLDAFQCLVGVVTCPDDMAFIPPGEVTLRDASGGGPVRLSGFFIDRTEVTLGKYLAFCDDAAWRKPSSPDPISSPELPVTSVTFYDALAYAVHGGKEIPTEAQWARAAYGETGASDRFPWGDTWKPAGSNVLEPDDGFPGLAPVRSFPDDCTAFGCMDMAGNAMEWTRSAFRPLPYDPSDGREDPRALFFGTVIALRGAHFQMPEAPLSARYSTPYESAFPTLGFRCVRELPTTLDKLEALL